MSRSLNTVFLVLVILQCSAVYGQAKGQNVYLVVAQEPGKPVGILQTGFRLRGTKGIITALHGVAGEKSISAWNEQHRVFPRLTVSRVDVRNDLALLTCAELESGPDDGLDSGANERLSQGESLTAWGHPIGIRLNKKPVKVGDPAQETLSSLIPPASASAFERRKSPAAEIQVIYLAEGNLVPGHSGSPLLSSSNRVVGVIDGGLLGGMAAISWAVPLSKVLWEDVGVARNSLNELDKVRSSDLFTLDDAPPQYFEGIARCGTRNLETLPFTCSAGNLLLEMEWAWFHKLNGIVEPNALYSFIPLPNGFRISGPFDVRGHLYSNVELEGRIGLKISTMDGSLVGDTRVVENRVQYSPVVTEIVNGTSQSTGPQSTASVDRLGGGNSDPAIYAEPAYPGQVGRRVGSLKSKGPESLLWIIRLGGLSYKPPDDTWISIESVDFVVGNL
jgi:hypothetical protein